MFSSDIPDDWTPPPPPDVGSAAWLDQMAFHFMVEAFNGLPDRSGVFELPRVLAGGVSYRLGYFVLHSRVGGKDYFRTDEIEAVLVRPVAVQEQRDD